jgi:hypothetical protein
VVHFAAKALVIIGVLENWKERSRTIFTASSHSMKKGKKKIWHKCTTYKLPKKNKQTLLCGFKRCTYFILGEKELTEIEDGSFGSVFLTRPQTSFNVDL